MGACPPSRSRTTTTTPTTSPTRRSCRAAATSRELSVPAKSGIGQFQSRVRYQNFDVDGGGEHQRYAAGVRYVIDSHNARVSVIYANDDPAGAADSFRHLQRQQPKVLLVDEPIAGRTHQETERTAELLAGKDLSAAHRGGEPQNRLRLRAGEGKTHSCTFVRDVSAAATCRAVSSNSSRSRGR